MNDEENRFVFSAEMHIKAIECASATWEEVQERTSCDVTESVILGGRYRGVTVRA